MNWDDEYSVRRKPGALWAQIGGINLQLHLPPLDGQYLHTATLIKKMRGNKDGICGEALSF